MKKEWLIKTLVIAIVLLIIFMSIIPSTAIISIEINDLKDNKTLVIGDGTEYWALLIAVGDYAGNPDAYIPEMLKAVDDLYNILTDSSSWSTDHIKVIKAEEATIPNIRKGFRWLDKMDDENDISLVFITTHGTSLTYDIPPKDEADNTDEALYTYWSFVRKTHIIWDDEINFLLNRLESQGVCLIVDSCFAGGFNDSFNIKARKSILPFSGIQISSIKWMEEFAEDVSGDGRVVIMSSHEFEASISGQFYPFLIDGLRGFADINLDGIVTAEELFLYIEPRCFWQHPTIYDGYADELPLIDVGFNKNHVAMEKNKSNNCGLESGLMYIYNNDYQGNAIVCGYVTDSETNDPIENTYVEIEWQSDAFNWESNWTLSDSEGFFSFNVLEGYVTIRFMADDFFWESINWFKVNENDIIWVYGSLEALPPKNAVVCGYVTDFETNEPLKNALVRLEWLDSQGHCYEEYSDVDEFGFYSINTVPGEIYLEPFAGLFYPWESTFRKEVRENETLWVNHSLLRSINVDISKPLKAIYIKNRMLKPFSKTLIFGNIDIEALIYGYYKEVLYPVDKVEFYIDGDLKNTTTSEPYKWTWDKKSFPKLKHIITVKAYEEDELVAENEIMVWKFF